MTSPSSTTAPHSPPRSITLIRLALILAGFLAVVNGTLELGPDAPPLARGIGVALIVVGLASWLMVYLLRKPGKSLRVETLVVVAATVVVHVVEYLVFRSPAILTTLILPAFIAWRLSAAETEAWLAMPPAVWQAQQVARREAQGERRGFPRAVAMLSAVGITGALLVVATGGAMAASVWPCSFQVPSVGGLNQDQVDLTADPLTTLPTGYLKATDGTDLAYFASIPAQPIATLVFYHGSGAHSTAGYLGLASQLAARYAVATYLVDIRGHGSSAGPRGDAPSTGQVWDDTQTMVDFVHGQYPLLPEYVGGHSAGAGVVLNSESRIDGDVAGYVFLAPDFGISSGTLQQGQTFATICPRAFAVDTMSNGLLDAHTYALGFAYTQEQIDAAGLVNRYTVTMEDAQNPATSASVLARLDKPLGVWIGADDEVFSPSRVLAYAQQHAGQMDPTLEQVPDRDHLGILQNGADYIGPWIDAHITSDGP